MMTVHSKQCGILVLDGGMGRELARMGAPFRQPEWSALALTEGPDFVRRAHLSFIAAGADIITTNSYAIVPFHIGEERFAREARELAWTAGALAREAVTLSGKPGVLVAGSLPPLFGSYRPELFNEARAPEILGPLVAGLSPWVDLWLAETQSSIAEARAARSGTAGDTRPFWLSFTLEDSAPDAISNPRLRSGEAVTAATGAALDFGADALLFNCSQPEVMETAIVSAMAGISGETKRLRLGVYANAFPPQPKEDAQANSEISPVRADLDPEIYCRFAEKWASCGAGIIGGCCGIGPEHIAAIRHSLGGGRP